jgi:hypothetical protein
MLFSFSKVILDDTTMVHWDEFVKFSATSRLCFKKSDGIKGGSSEVASKGTNNKEAHQTK